jgi:hypothetical protein
VNKLGLVVIAFICNTVTYAQSVTGTVKVVGKNLGTVTDDAAVFNLSPDKYPADSLRISILGYRP